MWRQERVALRWKAIPVMYQALYIHRAATRQPLGVGTGQLGYGMLKPGIAAMSYLVSQSGLKELSIRLLDIILHLPLRTVQSGYGMWPLELSNVIYLATKEENPSRIPRMAFTLSLGAWMDQLSYGMLRRESAFRHSMVMINGSPRQCIRLEEISLLLPAMTRQFDFGTLHPVGV
jgi:hypothetical protein